MPARPAAPAGTRLYAIGDIHGRADLLRRLYDAIADDAATVARRRRVLIHLGDYVDRGPDSRGVLDLVTAAPPAGFDTVCLRGNHEQMMLDYLDGRSDGDLWRRNGGEATEASYGVLTNDRDALLRALPPAHLVFLRGLGLTARFGDYLFVHAGIRPGVPLDRQDADDLLWIRQPFLDSDADHGAVVVHGHSVRPAPVFAGNRIGLDTGAYASGVLTALVLDGESRALLQT